MTEPTEAGSHRLRTIVRQWWPVLPLGLLAVLASLNITDTLRPTAGWIVRSRPPDFWSALASWVAVAVGIVTVVVAGRYAKQQVDKAQDQIREARTARISQEIQAQAALDTQIRLAEDQAQPVVVIYTDLNAQELQFIEIVVKNYGLTPAYDVKVEIDPILKASPNLVSDGRLADVPIPEFPILAPGQEWRTGWDYYLSRKDYHEKFDRLSKPEEALSEVEKLEIEYLRSENMFPLEPLASEHKVRITFKDGQDRVHTTSALLRSDLYEGTTRFTIKTMHNLVQLLENKLQ